MYIEYENDNDNAWQYQNNIITQPIVTNQTTSQRWLRVQVIKSRFNDRPAE